MLVTLEIVHLFQAILIMKDPKLKTEDISAEVQSSNLNEELGQIDYVFSDKTGTLTKNQMVFKKLSINGAIYGEDRSNINKGEQVYVDVDFGDKNFFSLVDKFKNQYQAPINQFLLSQAIAHTVMVEVHDGKSGFSVSSPDELALINFAKMVGFSFEGTDENNTLRIKNNGNIIEYQVLYTLEFNSARKRMSVIVKDKENQIILYTKGADSIIYARLKKGLPYLKETEEHLTAFGNEGLRTLVYARKVITSAEYADWSKRYLAATMAIEDRESKMEALQEEIETNLELLGSTAVEDKLQDEVSKVLVFSLF
jgi:phospholipid-transporting ATPase